MNIDLLFFDTTFEKKEEFIHNQEQFGEYISTHSFEGKSNELLFLPPSMSITTNKTLLVGCEDITNNNKELLELGYSIGNKLKENCELNILNFQGETEPIILGILLSKYSFDKYQSDNNNKVEINFNDSFETESLLQKRDSLFWVKDLINTPAFDRSPEYFIEQVELITSNKDIKVDVHNKDWLQKNNFGGVLGVSQGSVREPYFLVGQYNPDAEIQIALIGKGVLFDSGGLSLKSPSGMETMKTDMSGAATAWGTINLLAQNNIPVGLTVYTPLVENMPSGSAIRPGDVLTTRNGKTIEVLNTDAEGRLVLADALTYTEKKFKPQFMIDLATLTGAIIVSLGSEYAGLFSNNDKLSKQLIDAGDKVDEKLWRMPLHENFDKLINSKNADMQNINYVGGAGSTTAAQFLQRFILNKTPWAHLDIAGMAFSKYGGALNSSGATGYGVRLLNKFIEENYE